MVQVELGVREPTALGDELQNEARDREPDEAAEERQNYVFDDELSDQRPGRRAEGLAHADLAGALHNATDVNIDQVDRRQQHKQDHRNDDGGDQTIRLTPAKLTADAERPGRHPPREMLEVG